MTAALLLCLSLGGGLQDEAVPQAGDLAVALAAAVDLPTRAERQAAAGALAHRPGTDLAVWLTVCAGFGVFQPVEHGVQRHELDLLVGAQRERTELFLYVPDNHDPARPAPLLLLGHGAGGTGAGLHRMFQSVADRVGMIVLSPTEAGGTVGWAFSEREREAQLAALRWARRTVNVDEDRILIAGVSRGGHMTWDLILRNPDLFAAAAPVVGGPRLQLAGGQNNLRYLENVAHLSIRDLQGAMDDPLMVANLRLCFERLKAFGARDAVLLEQADRGHDADLGTVDWEALFGGARRQPIPDRVLRLATRKDQARAFWVEILGFESAIAEEFPLRVNAAKWNALDEAGQRAMLLDLAIDRTARLQVTMTAPGRFEASGRGVKRFRLLLSREMLDEEGRAEVIWRGRTIKRKLRQDPAVLLGEFVERFDRRFLPVAILEVP